MRKCVSWLICSCLFAMGSAGGTSAQGYDEQLVQARRMVGEGFDQWDEQAMLDARQSLEELLPKSDATAWLVHYYIGYADFRLSMFYRLQDRKDLQLQHLDQGIEHFNASLELNGDFAESQALLALLLGQKALMDPAQMASLGMQAQTAISEARLFGGENPRIAMISAIMYFFTPEQFGGSRTKAMEEMQRSISLFESGKPDDQRLPDWGHSDALVFLGRLQMEAQEYESAKQSLEKALQLNPRNRMAQRVKLQLEERIKK